MAIRFGRQHYSKLAGNSPGTLLPESKDTRMSYRLIRYDESSFSAEDLHTLDGFEVDPAETSVCWLQVFGIRDSIALEELGRRLGIHKLTLEDIQNTDRRFSMEQHPKYTFQTVKRAKDITDSAAIDAETISLVLISGLVISFHEVDSDSLSHFVQRIESGIGRIRRSGSEYLFYALNDEALDTWMVHLERIEDRLIELEDQVITRFDDSLIESIHSWKKHVAWLSWQFRPYQEMLRGIGTSLEYGNRSGDAPYFKDLSGHANRVLDLVDLYRDMVDDLLMIHMTILSNRMNRVMKVLTIISTIFIPITFIAGIYGMNFMNMPELSWRWGYPIAIGVMLVSVIGMLIFFRRKRWI